MTNEINEKEVWDKPNPVKKHSKLSSSMKARAKARAQKAGRPYPNMVDNIWAARNEELDETTTTSGIASLKPVTDDPSNPPVTKKKNLRTIVKRKFPKGLDK